MRAKPKSTKYRNLTETDLEEIEHLALEHAGEPYRGPLLALVHEVRRLREIVLQGEGVTAERTETDT